MVTKVVFILPAIHFEADYPMQKGLSFSDAIKHKFEQVSVSGEVQVSVDEVGPMSFNEEVQKSDSRDVMSLSFGNRSLPVVVRHGLRMSLCRLSY
jgi:hypothetical protein